jgi:hypothetical protein
MARGAARATTPIAIPTGAAISHRGLLIGMRQTPTNYRQKIDKFVALLMKTLPKCSSSAMMVRSAKDSHDYRLRLRRRRLRPRNKTAQPIVAIASPAITSALNKEPCGTANAATKHAILINQSQ